MKHTSIAKRLLSLALIGGLLLPSLSAVPAAAADKNYTATLGSTPISLNFTAGASGWAPTATPTQRLWLDIGDNTAVVDAFSYTLTSTEDNPEQRYEIDKYGYLTLKPGAIPIEGEELTVTANVNYYDGADVIFADNVTSTTKRFATNDTGTLTTTYDYTISDTSKVIDGTTALPAQVARTGRYGITTKNNSNGGAPSYDVGSVAGTLTAWYYDPVEAGKTLLGGDSYPTTNSDAQFGMHINAAVNASSPNRHYMGVAALSGHSRCNTNYYYRATTGSTTGSHGTWTSMPDNIGMRSEGWHKMEWVVDPASGLTMKWDGQTVYQDATLKALNKIFISNNKGYRDTTQSLLESRHFLDDISVVSSTAQVKTGTVSITVPVDYTAPTAPIISAQPSAQTVAQGADASFTVSAADPAEGTLSYQWYSCDETGENAVAVDNATTATLTVSSAQSDAYYYCAVSNASKTVKTDVVKLTILGEDTRVTAPSSANLGEDGSLTIGYADDGKAVPFIIKLYKKTGETDTLVATVEKELQPDHSNFVTGVSLRTEIRTAGAGGYYYTVQVSGKGTALDSNAVTSNTVTASKLAPPEITGWTGSTIAWNAVTGAQSYSVQLYNNGTASGDPVTVAAPATSAALPTPGAGPYTATVKAIADTATLFFDSDYSNPSAAMSQDLRLTLDGDGLHKGDTQRVYLEAPNTVGIDAFTYSVEGNSNVTVDQYGNLSMKPGYTPSADDEVTVKAEVQYYENPIWAYNLETAGAMTGALATNLVLSGTSKLADGQAARTGRLGGTVGDTVKDGMLSSTIGKTGKVVFWYYDPCTAEEMTVTYGDQAKFGMMLNAYTTLFIGVAVPADTDSYPSGLTKADKNTYSQTYTYRSTVGSTSGVWQPTNIRRTPGWHRMELNVTSAGTGIKIDGTDVIAYGSTTPILNTAVTSVSQIIMATNWGNKDGNLAYIDSKHFIDDIYMVDANAVPATTTVAATVKLLPTSYSLDPEQGSYELEEPSDLSVSVHPNLDEFESAALNGAALTAAQYAINGNVFTVKADSMQGLAVGDHTLTLSIEGQALTYTIHVSSNPGRDYYISNTGSDTNDGLTADTAWKTLSRLNALTFKAGDRIFLDAQSIWNEQLVLQGDGSAMRPILLTRYNENGGSQDRPIINGMGTNGTKPSYIVQDNSSGAIKLSGAVELWNSGYWEISWLEVTNMAATTGNGRSGIMVINDYCPDSYSDRTQANWWASRKDHVYITDCYVHDVNGTHQNHSPSGTKHAGGIIGYGYLSDFKVERCRVSRVDNEGIRNTIFNPGGTNSAAGYPADAATYLTFKNNFIDKVSGDAMVMAGGNFSEMSYNVATTLGRSYVSDKSGNNLADGADPVLIGTANYAAMWVMGCKNSVAQFNEVYDTQYDCPDGEAWDIDLYSENYVYQYNYSHNNAGGCVLFMNGSKNNIFRYNLSINDGGHFTSTTSNRKHLIYYAASGSSGTTAYPLIYNNVFNLSADINSLIDGNTSNSKYIHVQNNIFYAPNGNTPRLLFSETDKALGELTNNIFWPAGLYGANITSQLAAGATVSDNQTADPMLRDPSKTPTISSAWSSEWDGNHALTSLDWFNANLDQLGGYQLSAGSPAINAGVRVPYWSEVPEENRFPLIRDFFGNAIDETDAAWAPDIGIHEFAVEEGTFMVTFHKNGGGTDAEPSYLLVREGESLGALPTAPTRPEYIFLGWNTKADGSGDAFTADTAVTANLTVYAQWKALYATYTVTFDKNGGDTQANPSAKTVAEPATTVASLPTAPTRVGYAFKGWNTAPDGSGTAFTASTKVSASITVYAQWDIIPWSYTVTFDQNGGDTSPSPTAKTVSSPDTTVGALPTAPTRAGYTFTGWNTKADGSGTAFTADTTVTAGITVYAQWDIIPWSWTISFDVNDGSATEPIERTVSNPNTTVGELPAPPVREDYDFLGWNTEPDGSGTFFTAGTPVTASITVYAQWKSVDAYAVTYHVDGTVYAIQIVTAPAAAVGELPADPVRTGYDFLGWYTGPDGEGAPFTAETAVTGDIDLYAHWELIPWSYTVIFDSNGGETDPVTLTVATPDTTVGALPEAPTREGHTFLSWNTKADGSGDVFTEETEVTGDTTVYAQWELVPWSYTVTFLRNDGSDETDPTVLTVAAPATTVGTLPTAPTRSGYTFTGWNTAYDGSGTAFTADTPVIENITIYAQWKVRSSGGDSGGATKPAQPIEAPNVQVSASAGGTVSSKSNADGSITYTFTPDHGKALLYVRVNGLLADVTKPYTVSQDEAASIVVIFGSAGTDFTLPYADTADLPDYMADAVNYAIGADLLQGTSSGAFAPYGAMTRSMFAAVLARLYGADTSGYTANFSDVAPGAWYEGSVAWAAEMGFTSGVSATEFAPDREMTREELVTLIYRFARKSGADTSAAGDLTAFPDADTVSPWASDAMSWALGVGLIKGRGASLAPAGTITRAEVSIILQRMSILLVQP